MTEESTERATCPVGAIRTSAEIGKISVALAKAQGEIANPTKAKKATIVSSKGTYEYAYVDLADGLDEIRKAFSKHEISFVQVTQIVGPDMNLITRIMHAGEWIESDYPVCKIGGHQEMGGALTYSKRQALFAIAGVAGEDDLDAEPLADELSGKPKSKSQPVQPPKAKPAPPKPEIVQFSAEESSKEASRIIADMLLTKTREAAQKWADENSAKKQRLLPDDAKRVQAEFIEHQRALKAAA